MAMLTAPISEHVTPPGKRPARGPTTRAGLIRAGLLRPAAVEVDASGEPDAASLEAWRASRSPARRPGGTVRLWVDGLGPETSREALTEAFSHHGVVVDVHRARRDDGRLRTYAFVELAGADASTVIAAMHGAVLDGRTLVVRAARPRDAK